MKKSKTKLKDMLSEHMLGELPSSKLMKMKWNPVTGKVNEEEVSDEDLEEAAPKMRKNKEAENLQKLMNLVANAQKGGGSGRYGKEFDKAKLKALRAMKDMVTYSNIGG
tara:strand:+ start:476 stop:802 length:327 start_codon:yes stop_codon:yes gene_type:complete